MIDARQFTAANLNGSFELEWPHMHNTENVICKWYDELGIERSTFDLIQVIDENNIVLRCGEAITGTHRLVMEYQDAGAATAGRRLFELGTTADPSPTLRIPLGKASTPASNMTLSALLIWLMTKLGFLKVASNLSDLQSAAAARANLSVYSQSQVDSGLAGKASLYQAGSGAVLGINNTSIYNPVSAYQPATLRNVRNAGKRMLWAAACASDGTAGASFFLNSDVIDVGTTSMVKNSIGKYTIVHNLGHINYHVTGQAVGGISGFNKNIGKILISANSFTIYIGDDSGLGDSNFEFELYDYFTYTQDE